MNRRPSAVLRAALGHGAAATAAALLLVAAGQPLFTDDAWWHLALGRAFAEHGPWLAEDPLLFAAAGPPSPSSWLFDVALYRVHEVAGFAGLRALHVALVAAVLGLAWSLLRRATGSALAASFGTVILVALSTYRLAQLRPDLVTIGLSLAVHQLLVEGGRPPSVRRIAGAAALFALWANVHAAFPVGLLLLGAGTLGAGVPAIARGDAAERARVWRLGAALLSALAATLCNPLGIRAYAAWFAAGESTPSLGRIVDEWAGVDLFAWPRPTLPATPVAWMIVWGLLLGMALLLPRAATAVRGAPPRANHLDPAAVGEAAISTALLLGAVRFLWLGLFPLLWILRATGASALARPRVAWALAVAPALCTLAFVRWGDWPLVTRGLSRSRVGYSAPYASDKYYGIPVWVARDAGLEGRLYCDYFQAGFAGYWLAPRIRTLSNGTLNVSADTLRAAAALTARRGLAPGETFPDLLDRLGVDLFVGIRVPETGHPQRPWASTSAHLEDTPGWVTAFRNLTSALYVREDGEHLPRIAHYYASVHVPFDPARGFEPLRVIHAVPEWALAHGLVPEAFGPLEHAAHTHPGASGEVARDRVAAIYAALGLYTEAAALDRATLEIRPDAVRARRRLVWSLLHLRRYAEALDAAGGLAQQPAADTLSHAIARAARDLPAQNPDEARARLAALPVFARAEVPWLLADTAGPAARME